VLRRAAAHGGRVADGSNHDRRVSAVVDARTGSAVDDGELRWRVLANDALLELRNGGDAEVVVAGYEGEPYLRIGPDGVFENVASPASILNDDRYGLGTTPRGSSAEEPRWERVGSDPGWHWYDHRIHWMATTAPPQVKVGPQATVEVLTWQVPYLLDGQQRLAVTGELWGFPRPRRGPGSRPPSWASPPRWRSPHDRPTGVASRASRGAAGGGGAQRGGGAADRVSRGGRHRVLPGPAGANAVVLARACLLALPAFAAVPWVRRAGTGAALAVAVGAAILALGNAPQALAVLSTSQVASAAPAAARLVSALVLALALPTAVALIVALLGPSGTPGPEPSPRSRFARPAVHGCRTGRSHVRR